MFVNFKYLFVLFLSCISFYSISDEVSIENNLNECVRIESSNTTMHNNLWLLDLDLRVIKSTGYCGCKSAITGYSVMLDNEVQRSDRFALKKSREVSLILSSDIQLGFKDVSGVRIILACGS